MTSSNPALLPVCDSLGDRMKANYEDRHRFMLTRRTPMIVRVDGRAFHTYTRGMDRPFDHALMNCMTIAATSVFGEAQGCKLAYIQSDEASFLLTDFDTLTTQAWFDYNKSKVETIAAAVMTSAFAGQAIGRWEKHFPQFDARAFNIPESDVANYFLWRAKDWERNSISMYCRSFFSAKQMHGQGMADQHEMLHSIGKNWTTDLDDRCRNGTFIMPDFSARSNILPRWSNIDELVQSVWPKPTPVITAQGFTA